MKYASYDLGDQPAGSTAVVELQGSPANVILVDELNFHLYRRRRPFWYADGGLVTKSPTELSIPKDGHWFVLADLGGFSGRVRGTVKVLAPEEGREDKPSPKRVTSSKS